MSVHCPRDFARRVYYVRHLLKVHNGGIDISPEDREFVNKKKSLAKDFPKTIFGYIFGDIPVKIFISILCVLNHFLHGVRIWMFIFGSTLADNPMSVLYVASLTVETINLLVIWEFTQKKDLINAPSARVLSLNPMTLKFISGVTQVREAL